ncbi:MAG: cyclic nucleotide-binding domain-containing protein [Aggregatilineales bacterium]
MDDIIALLQQIDLFRGLDDTQLGQIAAISHREECSTGMLICEQGYPADKLAIITAGQVEVSVMGSDGNRHSALYLGEGQVIGEMGLIDTGRRSASVIAAEDNTVIYSIYAEDFTRLCETHTDLGYLIMRNIAQDLSFKLRHHDARHAGEQ